MNNQISTLWGIIAPIITPLLVTNTLDEKGLNK